MTLPRLHPRQNAIAAVLGVTPPFTNPAMLAAEALRRQVFIEDTLQASGLTTLVLGISGGVDSLVAGRLAQLAVQALRTRTRDGRYRFIAVRLPYGTQHDEDAARAALAFIRADEECTVPIENAVQALAAHLPKLSTLPARRRDVVLGNVKARTRMVAQYALANATGGLVIGTDHAAEAVMGFFTKFGDGACDLAPLSGLVKGQVRAIAASWAHRPNWFTKPPPPIWKTSPQAARTKPPTVSPTTRLMPFCTVIRSIPTPSSASSPPTKPAGTSAPNPLRHDHDEHNGFAPPAPALHQNARSGQRFSGAGCHAPARRPVTRRHPCPGRSAFRRGL